MNTLNWEIVIGLMVFGFYCDDFEVSPRSNMIESYILRWRFFPFLPTRLAVCSHVTQEDCIIWTEAKESYALLQTWCQVSTELYLSKSKRLEDVRKIVKREWFQVPYQYSESHTDLDWCLDAEGKYKFWRYGLWESDHATRQQLMQLNAHNAVVELHGISIPAILGWWMAVVDEILSIFNDAVLEFCGFHEIIETQTDCYNWPLIEI